jgi:hypothetical protein
LPHRVAQCTRQGAYCLTAAAEQVPSCKVPNNQSSKQSKRNYNGPMHSAPTPSFPSILCTVFQSCWGSRWWTGDEDGRGWGVCTCRCGMLRPLEKRILPHRGAQCTRQEASCLTAAGKQVPSCTVPSNQHSNQFRAFRMGLCTAFPRPSLQSCALHFILAGGQWGIGVAGD